MQRSVLVIGSGVAGISACLNIAILCPNRRISLISHHSPVEPSDDHSKIVRVDYANAERMEEALTAQASWKKGSFSPYYLPNGRIVAYKENSDTLRSIDQNRQQLGFDVRERGGKELLERHFGFSDAPDGLVFVYNPDDALVDWQPCIREHESKAKEACSRRGGAVYESKVNFLKHDRKRVTAVVLSDGDPINTTDMDVILAVGPWTMEVLKRSDIPPPPSHRIPIPTGIFAFELQLDDSQTEYFMGKPVLSHIGKGMSPLSM